VDPVICQPGVLEQFESSMLVFFTGRTRSASEILARQSEALKLTDRKIMMRRMVELAFEMKQELESGSVLNIGELLHENWVLKKQMSSGISDAQIDGWYQTGLKHGAKGGKLLGAGNGGFIMFFAPVDTHEAIRRALPDLQPVRFLFDRNGSQIVFYQPNV
jgi:D-glycero-alpha-D-manno-heptose-7-phosphate kinase